MKVETGMMKAGAEAQRIREGVRGGVRLSELRNSVSGFRACLIHAERLRRRTVCVYSKRRNWRGLFKYRMLSQGEGLAVKCFITDEF
jgi:hypothetical protein